MFNESNSQKNHQSPRASDALILNQAQENYNFDSNNLIDAIGYQN